MRKPIKDSLSLDEERERKRLATEDRGWLKLIEKINGVRKWSKGDDLTTMLDTAERKSQAAYKAIKIFEDAMELKYRLTSASR